VLTDQEIIGAYYSFDNQVRTNADTRQVLGDITFYDVGNKI